MEGAEGNGFGSCGWRPGAGPAGACSPTPAGASPWEWEDSLCRPSVSGLGLQTFPHIGKAGNTAAQRLGTWALKSDRHGASQHCLLQAGDLRQIALCMYKQARISLGIELSRTHKKLPTVVAPGKEDMGWVRDGPSLTVIASEFMPQACVI